MASAPDQLTLGRHRDLHGRENRPYIRWALLSLLGVVCLLGLLNAFGQRPHTRTGSDSASSSRSSRRSISAAASSSCRASRSAGTGARVGHARARLRLARADHSTGTVLVGRTIALMTVLVSYTSFKVPLPPRGATGSPRSTRSAGPCSRRTAGSASSRKPTRRLL